MVTSFPLLFISRWRLAKRFSMIFTPGFSNESRAFLCKKNGAQRASEGVLFGTFQNVIHLVDVVGVEAQIAMECKALVGLIRAMISVKKPQVHHAFWTGTTTEETVGKGVT